MAPPKLTVLPPLAYYRRTRQVSLHKVAWYWPLVRAFIIGDEIVVMQPFVRNVKLIAHELGHYHELEGDYFWPPTIMNASGLLRWRVTEQEKPLLEEARTLIAAAVRED